MKAIRSELSWIIILTALLSFNHSSPSFCQSILWARSSDATGGQPLPSSSLHGIFLAQDGWQFWPISNIGIPIRSNLVDSFGIGVYVSESVLINHDSVIASCTGNRIILWNPLLDSFTVAFKSTVGISRFSCSDDASVIAILTTDDSVHLIGRSATSHVPAWCDTTLRAFCISSDGNLLLSSNDSEHLQLVDVKSGKIIREYSNIVFPESVQFSPSQAGTFIVEAYRSGNYELLLMDTSGKVFGSWQDMQGCSFSPSGNKIVGKGFLASHMTLIDVQTKRSREVLFNGVLLNDDTLVANDVGLIELYSISEDSSLSLLSCLFAQSDVNYSADGKLLAGGSFIWEPLNGGVVAGPGIGGSIGNQTIVAGGQGQIFVWKSPTEADSIIKVPSTDTLGSYQIAVSPSDSIFATGYSIEQFDNPPTQDSIQAIQLWSVNARSIIRTFETPLWPARTIAFSHNGQFVAASLHPNYYHDSTYVWNIGQDHPAFCFRRSATNIFFLSGDTTILLVDQGLISKCSLNTGEIVDVSSPSMTATNFALLPGQNTLAGIRQYYSVLDPTPDPGIELIDINSGAVLKRIPTPDSQLNTCITANPVTGDIAIGGRELVVYRSTDVSLVNAPKHDQDPIGVYVLSNELCFSGDAVSDGSVNVFSSVGTCVYMAITTKGQTIHTGILPPGVYFVVFTGSDYHKRLVKVSLFE